MIWKGIKSTSQDKQIQNGEQASYSQSKTVIKYYKVIQGEKKKKEMKTMRNFSFIGFVKMRAFSYRPPHTAYHKHSAPLWII